MDEETLLRIETELAGAAWTQNRLRERLTALCAFPDGRFAGTAANRAAREYILARFREAGLSGVRAETFQFLGFDHICGRKHGSGGFIVKRRTSKKRLRERLRTVKAALMANRHLPIPEQGSRLRAVVQGYLNYHAVPGNYDAVAAFRLQSVRHWLHALRRRSQRHRMPWERFGRISDRWIPSPRILHPYPNDRFYAKHPK